MEELTLRKAKLSEVKKAEKKEVPTRLKKRKWILILSISLALVLSVTGLFISGLAYLKLVEPAQLLNKIGTFLVLFAAPLYFLAAHCIDKIDFRKKSNIPHNPDSGQKSL